jgi:hypothetical protein
VKGGQAEFDDRGVEAEEFSLEPEFVARGHGRASLIQFPKECLEKLGRALGIGIGKGGVRFPPKFGPPVKVESASLNR